MTTHPEEVCQHRLPTLFPRRNPKATPRTTTPSKENIPLKLLNPHVQQRRILHHSLPLRLLHRTNILRQRQILIRVPIYTLEKTIRRNRFLSGRIITLSILRRYVLPATISLTSSYLHQIPIPTSHPIQPPSQPQKRGQANINHLKTQTDNTHTPIAITSKDIARAHTTARRRITKVIAHSSRWRIRRMLHPNRIAHISAAAVGRDVYREAEREDDKCSEMDDC